MSRRQLRSTLPRAIISPILLPIGALKITGPVPCVLFREGNVWTSKLNKKEVITRRRGVMKTEVVLLSDCGTEVRSF